MSQWARLPANAPSAPLAAFWRHWPACHLGAGCTLPGEQVGPIGAAVMPLQATLGGRAEALG